MRKKAPSADSSPIVNRDGNGDAKKERKVEITRGENFGTLYANHVACTITPWDFQFRFGLIQDATEEKLVLQEGLGIYMSPLHAKAFFGLMKKQLGLYEEKYGPIQDPKGTAVQTKE